MIKNEEGKMTKQKEISRWFCRYLANFNGQLDYDKLPQHRKDSYKMMVMEDIIPFLHSQDVAIKVEGELPVEITGDVTLAGMELLTKELKSLLSRLGYTAWEPLIKE